MRAFVGSVISVGRVVVTGWWWGARERYCGREGADGSPLEACLSAHTDLALSHGLCPACMRTHYGAYLDEEWRRLTSA